MGYELIEDGHGDIRNAATLCYVAELAYLPATDGAKAFKNDLSLDATLFSVDNTQAYLAANDDHVVVAFRGTESPTSIDGLKDWFLADALNLLIVPEGRLGHDLAAAGVGAKFHKGFADSITEIWDPLSTAVDAEMKRKDRPLWIAGHSLGGALALYCAWLLKRKFIPVHQIYTYGAPMIGNQHACDAFNREFSGQIFRYLSGKDPVPKLPSLSLIANEYAHVETAKLVGPDPASGLLEFLGGVGSAAVGGILAGKLLDDAWDYILQHVNAHFLDGYSKLLA